MSLLDLKVEDRVQVFQSYRSGCPKGGYDGEVIKVGRVLVTVAYLYGQSVFRMETGRINDDYGHTWIKTPEQVAQDLHRSELVKRLEEFGLRHDRHWLPTRKLEAIVKVLEDMSDEQG